MTTTIHEPTPARTVAMQKVEAARNKPDPALLARIRGRTWTGHNIPLARDEATIGMHIPPISDDERTLTIKSLVYRWSRPSPATRVLDLGALEGGLSFEMACEGWNSLGIEGRRDNFEKAELIREYFQLENLRFEHRDVRSLDHSRDGSFDVILCCGILYHLDDPFGFLETLRGLLADDGLLFLDTHVAPDEQALRHGTHAEFLSPPLSITHAGQTYEGRWFAEPRAGSVLDQQWSAISNDRSFWPSRRSLIRGVYNAGFHSIAELFGIFEIDREFGLRDQFSRLYLACRPSW